MFKKKKSLGYREGVKAANRDLAEKSSFYYADKLRDYAKGQHQACSIDHFKTRASKGAKAAAYDQGRAEAYGQYAYSGKKIK